MMLQYDISDHDWLEARGPKIKLVGGIDDATKDVPWAQFTYEDSVKENMLASKRIVEIKGISLPESSQTKARKYQILPKETRFDFAKAKLEVQKHLNGIIHISCKGQELPFKPIIPQEDERYAPSEMETSAVGV